MKKKRFVELDVIRAISAILVVCYHFTVRFEVLRVRGFANILYLYPNGNWGETAVSIFFMLSGASLLYNYEGKKIDIKSFYRKRWLGLFPMFYLMWILMYFIRVVQQKSWFWGGNPKLMMLSLLGMDGYFYYLKPNYHSIGEWFLGAIIFLYIAFPLLKKLFERYRWQTTIGLAVAWAIILHEDWFLVSDFRNIITCVVSFWIGMLLMAYRKYMSLAGIVGTVLFVVFNLYVIPGSTVIKMNVMAASVFCMLFLIARWIMKIPFLQTAISSVSKYSYPIFLTHHVIIDNWIGSKYRDGMIDLKLNLAWLLGVLVVSYVSAVALQKTTGVLFGKRK